MYLLMPLDLREGYFRAGAVVSKEGIWSYFEIAS